MDNKRRITILGSTGSIGTQALEVIEKLSDKFEITGLAGGNNTDLLFEQIQKFKPKYVYSAKYDKRLGECAKYLDSLEELCSLKNETDVILVAVSGKIGLKPTLAAIENGIDIALANKETLVMAGDIVMAKAKEHGVKIIPVDSEHSAIHQCIKDINQVKKIIITASGGPFLHKTIEEMKSATIEETLNHPNWHMGKKITVDSATLMNKGLEIIEAHHLFNMSYDNIEVIIHPQSYIHSAVEYADGSIVAQIGVPSMHIPIQYAITYPERYEGIKTESFSFTKAMKFDFETPDFKKFPSLNYAYTAGKKGGNATAILNAINEEAVFAFLDGKIKLYDIYNVIEKVTPRCDFIESPTLEEITESDKHARELTNIHLQNKKHVNFC